VLFDLGGVLISLRPIHQVFPVDVARPGATREEIERALASFRLSEVFDRYERGRATREEFFAEMRVRFPTSLSDDELEACYARILGDEIPGMYQVVDEVLRHGMRAAGLTDTSPIHLRILERYPSVRRLEKVVASCVTGLRKPDPAAFLEAVRHTGLEVGDVYYVDDVAANVEGARRAGLRADVFRGPDSVREALAL
jgi:FMN phosphatase YigB (HAD superfamily)